MTTTMTNSSGTEIHPGQIWADRDSRCVGRTVHIASLDPVTRKAHCHVRTDTGGTPPKSPRTVKILIDRLRPTSTGFTLVGCTRHEHCDNRGPAEEPTPTTTPDPEQAVETRTRFTVRVGDGAARHYIRPHEQATLCGAERRRSPSHGYRTLPVTPTAGETATCTRCLRLATHTPQ